MPNPIKRRYIDADDQNLNTKAKAMSGLVEDISYNSSRRIFACATEQKAIEAFKEVLGVDKPSNSNCIQRLFGKSCALNRQKLCDCSPPGDDHGQLWLKDGKPYAYSSQPYSIGGETLNKIYQYAKDHNLDVTIRADWAFYFPSSALIVVYTNKEA